MKSAPLQKTEQGATDQGATILGSNIARSKRFATLQARAALAAWLTQQGVRHVV